MECKACNHELRCSVCDSFAEDRDIAALEAQLVASEAKCAELLSMIADLGEEIAAALARAEAAELWMYALGDFAKRAVQLFRDFAEKVDPNHEKPMANAIDALGMILEDHLAALRQAMGD